MQVTLLLLHFDEDDFVQFDDAYFKDFSQIMACVGLLNATLYTIPGCGS